MNRFLGSKKDKAPPKTMGDVQGGQQKRIDDLQKRVRALDSELVKYREQLRKARPGTSTHNSVKRRCVQLMKQRKMYDQQLGQMMNMEFNMSQIQMTQETIASTVEAFGGMKTTAKEMKKAQKAGKLDKVDAAAKRDIVLWRRKQKREQWKIDEQKEWERKEEIKQAKITAWKKKWKKLYKERVEKSWRASWPCPPATRCPTRGG